MGISCGLGIYYKLQGLDMKHLVSVATGINPSRPENPRIYIDCSWIGYYLNASLKDISSLLQQFRDAGFHVYPVIDPISRDHTKRICYQRAREKEISEIKMKLLHCKIASLMASEYTPHSETANQIKAHRKDLSKQQSRMRSLPSSYREDIEIVICNLQVPAQNGGCVKSLITAGFQADSYIAMRMKRNETELVLCNDSDLFMLSGVVHMSTIQVSKFSLRKRQPVTMTGIEIVTPLKAVMDGIVKTMGDAAVGADQSNIRRIDPSVPLIQYIRDFDSPILRGLIAVSLGCDTYPGGLYGIKPKKLWQCGLKPIICSVVQGDRLSQNDRSASGSNISYDYSRTKRDRRIQLVQTKFLEWMVQWDKKRNAASNSLHMMTFALAFIGEPAITADERAQGAYKFLYGPRLPEPLPVYLSSFVENCSHAPYSFLENGNILTCHGSTSMPAHPMLQTECSFQCHGQACDVLLCKQCCVVHNSATYCANCYKDTLFDGIPNNERRKAENSLFGSLSDTEMMSELQQHGYEVSFGEIDSVELVDIYESYVSTKGMKTVLREAAKEVRFPSLSPAEYDEKSKTLMVVNLCDGGSFVADDDKINHYHLPQVVSLFAMLVNFSSDIETDRAVMESSIFQAMPDCMIKFAMGSRLDSGHRLLKRAARHVFDPKFDPIQFCGCQIVLIENGNGTKSVGLDISHTVAASMKQQTYDVRTVFTSDKLVSCRCSCKAGGSILRRDRVTCVHSLSPPCALGFLLFDGLAEHFLLEFSARWKVSSSSCEYPDNILKSLKEDILTLMRAAGNHHLDSSKSLDEILETYSVGTDKRKKIPVGKVDRKYMQPIRKLDFSSDAKNAREKVIFANRRLSGHQKEGNEAIVETNTTTFVGDQDMILLRKDTNGILPSTLCKCCNELTTRNYCQAECKDGLFTLDGKVPICGFSFCIPCATKQWNSENRTKCDIHQERAKPHSRRKSTNAQMSRSLDQNFGIVDYPSVLYMANAARATLDEMKVARQCVGIRVFELRVNNEIDLRSNHWRKGNKERLERDWIQCFSTQTKRGGVSRENVGRKQKIKRKHENGEKERVPPHNKAGNIAYRTRAALTLHREEQSGKKARKDSKRKAEEGFRRCAIITCSNRRSQGMHRIPAPISMTDIKGATSERRKWKIQQNKIRRKWLLNRCGLGFTDSRKDLRICEDHEFETLTRKLEISHDGTKITKDFLFRVPLPAGPKSNLPQRNSPSKSKGVGRDRFLQNILWKAREDESEWATVAQQISVVHEYESNHCCSVLPPINQEVARAAGLPQLADSSKPQKFDKDETDSRSYFLSSKQSTGHKENDNTNERMYIKPEHRKPTVTIGCMTDDEVKRRTNVSSEAHLLFVIILICNGDSSLLTETKSVMTWYEEWFFFFEYAWGRTLTRWIDAASYMNYGINPAYLLKVYDHKLEMVIQARKRWPKFVSYNEDIALRRGKWNDRYRDLRIIQWDNTNICMFKPGNASKQRGTYSPYYSMNCAKGGVFVQLCGWIGTSELWPGSVSDTEYFNTSGILEDQDKFSREDLVEGKHIPFTNILDKGYRSIVAAHRAGKQLVLQPDFSKGESQFHGIETISSAAIATDRSANERAVRLAKEPGYIRRGLKPNQDARRLDDTWLACSFLQNFIKGPVL